VKDAGKGMGHGQSPIRDPLRRPVQDRQLAMFISWRTHDITDSPISSCSSRRVR
jgi:hypothetical protein